MTVMSIDEMNAGTRICLGDSEAVLLPRLSGRHAGGLRARSMLV